MKAVPATLTKRSESPALSEALNALGEEVSKAHNCPVSVFHVAALLEISGVTDAIAQRRYGHANVFELAGTIAQRLSRGRRSGSLVHAVSLPDESTREVMLDYLRGPLAIVPIVLLSLILAAFRVVGSWGYGAILATSMAMICSLLVTSGFVQAASRKGASYLSQGYVDAARRSVGWILGAGLLLVIGSAAFFAGIALSRMWFPPGEVALVVIVYIALSCLWFVSGVLYLLRQVHWYAIALAIGVAVSAAVMWAGIRFGLPAGIVLLVAALLGLSAAFAVTVLAVRGALSRETEASKAPHKRVVLAPSPQIVVSLSPYFIYGIVYVVFILSGHVAGWLGRLPDGITRLSALAVIEVGLTLALGGNILASGVAETTMRRFWLWVQPYQQSASQDQPKAFNRVIEGFVSHERRHFVRAVLLCSALTLAGIQLAMWVAGGAADVTGPLLVQAATVFLLGLIGYGLMAVASFDSMFMVTLSRPRPAIGALGIGILVTLVIGSALGQLISYQFSAVGVALGGLAFAVVARARVRIVLAHADYYYYSSF